MYQKKAMVTIMIENGTVVITNSVSFVQQWVDPKKFASEHHGKFHSSRDCLHALMKLVEGNPVKYEPVVTPQASQMISQIYRDSNKLS